MKKIMVVATSTEHPSLHDYEFVRPVKRRIEKAIEKEHVNMTVNVEHYTSLTAREPEGYAALVFCGSALGDNGVLDHAGDFGWLRDFHGAVVGICVGASLLSKVYGGDVRECTEIGPYVVETDPRDPLLGPLNGKTVYEIHLLAPSLPSGAEKVAWPGQTGTGKNGTEEEGTGAGGEMRRRCDVQAFRIGSWEKALETDDSGRVLPRYGVLFHPEVRYQVFFNSLVEMLAAHF